jgi:hypothetical protein
MTSEIAVMNRGAVALAADSAVSVSAGRRNKVFNSANKLFMLSDTHPVGIMIYANGSLMGVPWEVLVKTFRQELGAKEFDRLSDYGDAFISYLERQTALFTPELEKDYFLKLVAGEFDDLARKIKRQIAQEELNHTSDVEWDAARREIVSSHIRACHQRWSKREPHPEIDENVAARFRGMCSGELANLAMEHFRQRLWTVASDDTRLLYELAEFFVEKKFIAPSSYTGVVVAGFGRADFFPVLKRYSIGHFYDGKLKRIDIAPVAISEKKPVHIGVYADSDMADLFLRGISMPALDFLIEKTFEIGAEIATAVVEATGVPETPALWDAVESKRDAILMDLVGNVRDYRAETTELEQALIHIPKDELASVAASLVNLNSFKKRMSMGVETVGGPVDVAVISKGDGFIWIDRKHYFEADKNPQFMRKPRGRIDSQAGA